MDLKLQRDIFIGFFRAGLLGYGGGPSSIPLVHTEVVTRYGWMTDEAFGDVLALANTLPGPIATKMAGYIGYKQGGWLGLVNAIIATVAPTVVMMLGLAGLLAAFRQSPVVKGMTEAIAPIIAVMLAPLANSMFKESKAGLGWKGCIILTAASLLLMEGLDVHPGLLIGALIVYGLAGPELRRVLSMPVRVRRSKGAARQSEKSESL
ncbi:chromate transporter [Paenibacillus cremeus]|uniref:Chromate transporter n=1 Tax=Paenibacillus cremeus TaxID=2163881 RepID=A0A559K8Y3_9BACL|nr:chromate transporter [Paenibacillus cremeus]